MRLFDVSVREQLFYATEPGGGAHLYKNVRVWGLCLKANFIGHAPIDSGFQLGQFGLECVVRESFVSRIIDCELIFSTLRVGHVCHLLSAVMVRPIAAQFDFRAARFLAISATQDFCYKTTKVSKR